MYKVVVDIAPKTISGTNGCHMFVYGSYKTKREARFIADSINDNGTMGRAFVEKER